MNYISLQGKEIELPHFLPHVIFVEQAATPVVIVEELLFFFHHFIDRKSMFGEKKA